jgi:hypothetical protein
MQADIDLLREIENPTADVLRAWLEVPAIRAAWHVTLGTRDPVGSLRRHFISEGRSDIVELIEKSCELVGLRIDAEPRLRRHLANTATSN